MEEIEKLLSVANKLFDNGYLNESKEIFKEITEKYPRDWRGWWGIVQSTPIEECLDITDIRDDSLNTIKRIEDIKAPSWEYEYKMALFFAPDMIKRLLVSYKERYVLESKKLLLEKRLEKIEESIEKIKDVQTLLSERISSAEEKGTIALFVLEIALTILFISLNHNVFVIILSAFIVFISSFFSFANKPKKPDIELSKANMEIITNYEDEIVTINNYLNEIQRKLNFKQKQIDENQKAKIMQP